ncbi:MAG: sigma 54-interacting transcriptional regulator [Syntrophaceae bacterium]|nr:sigma 54-interacting transcriptional regulator [Syntrophaceae bacterium]
MRSDIVHGKQIPVDVYAYLPEILDSVSDAVVIVDVEPEPHLVLINKLACEILKIKAEDWLGKSRSEYIGGLIDRSLINDSLREGKETMGLIHTKDGVEVLSRTRPVFDANGKLKFAIVTTMTLKELFGLKSKLEKERYEKEKYRQEVEHLRRYVMAANDHIFQREGTKSQIEFVKKVAPVDCTVLIMGESGVGKEVLAKTIHTNSPRADMPFVPVSIPAIPENLLEAELFGYEEGAFTGSRRGGKTGLFEMAQGGTLFLDEVGDIPPVTQVKILRAIDNGEIIRVGGTKSIKLDVRIISATNKNMAEEVKEGRFRGDLFYRLNVVPFIIHPLRERREIIIPLSVEFLKVNNLKYGFDKKITEEALEELRRHSWPGNIRELKNVVERLTIMSDSQVITDSNVREILSTTEEGQGVLLGLNKYPAVPEASPGVVSIMSEYESYEQSRILEALKQAGGSRTKAARILNISRTKLYQKLKKNSSSIEPAKRTS